MHQLVGYLPEPVYTMFQNITQVSLPSTKFTIAILENIQKRNSHFGVLPICMHTYYDHTYICGHASIFVSLSEEIKMRSTKDLMPLSGGGGGLGSIPQ